MAGANGRLGVAVAGATGYIGMQCTALAAAHPRLELRRVLARSTAGRRYSDTVPGSGVDLVVEAGDDVGDAEVVLCALPHTVAAAHAAAWLREGRLVVDMSADFRLRDVGLWERTYRADHPAPDLCATAVYGLVELHRAELAGARLVAAPGCYATASILAAAPALRAGLVEPDVVVDGKSGVSGAGRSPTAGVHFSEVNESVHAYAVGGHRHRTEMEQELGSAAGAAVRVTFVAHLVPMTRGILATAYLRPLAGVTHEELAAAYDEMYGPQPCVRVVASPPPTKSVSGTNVAAVHAGWQDGVAVVTCAVDNLLKGAAGQGIQALNVAMGWPETEGLPLHAAWP
ncbi:MAG TPA: N-acetyl-gamma-glutamyl-phosphate reductase [Candidatus Dormibacteraeota bacterium]|nr:N-acetyl-gamma-glutamyl-phosphate reductase [Candidatus Dormibacteraeota bacterium]